MTRLLRVVVFALVAALLVALALVFSQNQFAASKFEFGHYEEYAGVFHDWPYPMLTTFDATSREVCPCVAPRTYSSYLFITSAAFVPPKPKLFESP